MKEIEMKLRLAPLAAVLMPLLLAACVGGGSPKANVAYYDLSAEPVNASVSTGTALRTLDVVPSTWLSGNAMYYRLAYADSNRRESFVNSRWSAQPAELISTRLQRSLLSASQGSVPFCRLRVDLDDLSQVFDSERSSRLVLEARATLYGVQQRVLARRTLAISQPAGADAQSGVAASGALTAELARELHVWVQRECVQPVAAAKAQ
ncbi:MAG: PqiC family protein [Rhodocyclaceae bacterium]|nr:PqiC family protein [Rhodocyclaceae bacterium]